MEELSIGIGLFINLIFSEVMGITAGGMVVPGYIALHLDAPGHLVGTLLVSLMTFLTIRFMSHHMILYGRRHLMFSILIGFLLARAFDYVTDTWTFYGAGVHLKAIGMIVPGLIAYWMERQGVVESICGLLIGSVMTRLVLILAVGGNL